MHVSKDDLNTKPGFFKPPQPRQASVVRTEQLSAHLVRVVLTGDKLKGFPEGWESAHIKLIFKRPDQDTLTLPELGPKGPVWPEGQPRPDVRVFSVRSYDAATNELAIDFALHEQGVASAFARNAKPGDIVGVGGPAGYCPKLPEADCYLFAGDLSAVSGMGGLLATLPDHAKGHAIVLAHSEADAFDMPHPPGIELQWLYDHNDPANSSQLVDAVKALDLPHDGLQVWVAGENAMVVGIRDHLRQTRGLTPKEMYAVPFWKRGLDEEAYHEKRHEVMDEFE